MGKVSELKSSRVAQFEISAAEKSPDSDLTRKKLATHALTQAMTGHLHQNNF